MSDVKKRAIDLASYDALIHCISWIDIKSTLVDLVAECERLEANQPSGITATAKADELLDAYWNAAYQEGSEQRDHDDEEGSSQKASYELLRYINALESERDALKSLVCKACNGVGSVGRMTVDGWEDDDCPYCVGQIKDQARNQAARECVEIAGNYNHAGLCRGFIGDVYCSGITKAIRQHFGMDDRFAGSGKVMEGSEK